MFDTLLEVIIDGKGATKMLKLRKKFKHHNTIILASCCTNSRTKHKNCCPSFSNRIGVHEPHTDLKVAGAIRKCSPPYTHDNGMDIF